MVCNFWSIIGDKGELQNSLPKGLFGKKLERIKSTTYFYEKLGKKKMSNLEHVLLLFWVFHGI